MNARVRLVSTKRITTKTGKAMTTGFCYADIQGEKGFPLSLVCWNDLAEELARYGKGDTLTVNGRLQANDYTNKQGEEVSGYQLIVDGLMGVKRTSAMQDEVKPRRHKTNSIETHPNQAGGVRFDDVPNF
jgi:single-stranded DNA-binding protein